MVQVVGRAVHASVLGRLPPHARFVLEDECVGQSVNPAGVLTCLCAD